MADNYTLIAQYSKQAVTQDRQASALLKWSSYITAQPIPTTKPAENWVQQRITAARIPQMLPTYVQRTIAYSQQDPTIIADMRKHLSPWNDETTEATLAAQLDSAIAVYMPQFCKTDVTDAQVQQWYEENGFAEPPAQTRAPMLPMNPPATGLPPTIV